MQLLSSARKLKEREETPAPFVDPYSDMTPEEKSKMIIELMAARERDAERIERDQARIDELLSKVDELLSLQKAALAAEKERDDYKQLVSNLLSKIAALEEQLKVRNKTLYGGKSQKGIHKRSGRGKKTIPVTRMILMALPNPWSPPCRLPVRLPHGKRTWKQNPKRRVFIGRDFLTVP